VFIHLRAARFAAWLVLVLAASAAPPAQAASAGSLPHDFVDLGGAAVFVAHTSGHPEPRPEHTSLWRTDGTAPGTFELRLCGAVCDPQVAIVARSEELAFVYAYDDQLERRLWRTDGTQEGTRRLTSFQAVGLPAESRHVVWDADAERLYFVAEEVAGWSLWVSDGTAVGTLRVYTFAATVQTAPFGLGEHDGAVYFFVSPSEPNTGAYELWRSGGTTATTAPVRLIPGFITPFDTVAPLSLPYGTVFAVQTPNGGGERLWRSDGTAAGTAPMAAFDATLDFQPKLVRIGDLAWFWGVDETGRQFWASDGSEAGTRKLTAIPGGNYRNGVLDPIPWKDGVLFGAEGTFFDFEIWASDGTPQGTELLLETCPGACTLMPVLNDATEDTFYFTTWDGSTAVGAAWASDGTPAGTRELAPGVSPSMPSMRVPAILVADDHLFFRGSRPPDGYEQLWAIERASGELRQLTSFASGHLLFGHTWEVEVFGDRLLFAADDGVHGLEPWISDGTPQGTRMIADIATGGDGFPSCQPSENVLCLQGNRFRVEVAWNDHHNGGSGFGRAIPATGSDISGYFWFFAPDNVELIVKILDGTTINGFYWTFYGALTDLEYEIVVSDTVTGESRTFYNPPGEICGQGDTASLPGGGVAHGAAATTAAVVRQRSLSLPAAVGEVVGGVVAAAHPTEVCVSTADTLCLLDDRFRVRVDWQDQHNGGSGTGGVLPFSDSSGFFWFFTPDNVEFVVKALDARVVNGHFWFFYGALSDVGYTITVEDLVHGHRARQYVNPPGEICGRGDTAAFLD
jgi:ELWxxDGT repeat protein